MTDSSRLALMRLPVATLTAGEALGEVRLDAADVGLVDGDEDAAAHDARSFTRMGGSAITDTSATFGGLPCAISSVTSAACAVQ